MDFGRSLRERFLRECPQEIPDNTLDGKVNRAIKRLGRDWVMHPTYNRLDHPQHTYPGSYVLRDIMASAKLSGRI